jgi:Mg2+/Co2+ transporter CorC
LWEERLKNFRSIRRGLAQVVEEINAGTFGNVYKGSLLETVVGSIAEQRQIFKEMVFDRLEEHVRLGLVSISTACRMRRSGETWR